MNAQTEVSAVEPGEKEDLYYGVHKGIRLANARMLIALGQADAADDLGVAEVLAALERHLTMSLSHLTHENHEIHTALEARCPGGSDHAAEDHDHHLQAFDELRALAVVAAEAGPNRARALRRLYQRFALFMADDLSHMHEEETEIMPMIEANFHNDEIVAIRERIVGAIPPAEMALFMPVMLGAASRSERIGMVSGMHVGMPAEVFDGMMAGIVGARWRMGDWAALEAAVC